MCVCAYGKEAVWNGRIVNQVVYFVSEGLEGIRPGEGDGEREKRGEEGGKKGGGRG